MTRSRSFLGGQWLFQQATEVFDHRAWRVRHWAGFAARPAMFANGTWYLRNTVTTTSTVTSFRFGANSQRPVVWTVRLS